MSSSSRSRSRSPNKVKQDTKSRSRSRSPIITVVVDDDEDSKESHVERSVRYHVGSLSTTAWDTGYPAGHPAKRMWSTWSHAYPAWRLETAGVKVAADSDKTAEPEQLLDLLRFFLEKGLARFYGSYEFAALWSAALRSKKLPNDVGYLWAQADSLLEDRRGVACSWARHTDKVTKRDKTACATWATTERALAKYESDDAVSDVTEKLYAFAHKIQTRGIDPICSNKACCGYRFIMLEEIVELFPTGPCYHCDRAETNARAANVKSDSAGAADVKSESQ